MVAGATCSSPGSEYTPLAAVLAQEVTPPPPPKRCVGETPELVAIARRAKPSAVPGNVKLTMTFDIPRRLAEQLAAQAVREGVNLEAVIVELMRRR